MSLSLLTSLGDIESTELTSWWALLRDIGVGGIGDIAAGWALIGEGGSGEMDFRFL